MLYVLLVVVHHRVQVAAVHHRVVHQEECHQAHQVGALQAEVHQAVVDLLQVEAHQVVQAECHRVHQEERQFIQLFSFKEARFVPTGRQSRVGINSEDFPAAYAQCDGFDRTGFRAGEIHRASHPVRGCVPAKPF